MLYQPVNTPMLLGQKLSKENGAPRADGRTYRSLIGSLMYLTITCLDIVFVVNYLSRFMQDPSQIHYPSAKRVLRYLKGTLTFDMHFMRSNSMKLVGFIDSDWGGSDETISISGYCFSMGGGIFRRNSKKELVVAHSTAKTKSLQFMWQTDMTKENTM